MDHLEKEGELLRTKKEVQLEPDLGAISRAISDRQLPGVLADNIYGFENARVAIGLSASWRRTAMVLGLPKEASHKEMARAWEKALTRYPVKAKTVAKKDAPCKENILLGDEVNLFDFPIPRINFDDAGPFITKTEVITKDPDSDWVNLGTFRMQVLNHNTTGMLFSYHRHTGEHYNKARRYGKPLQVAVAVGTDPAVYMASGVRVPREWNEYDFAGALRQAPVELVQAETVDLPVPATAELVLEGELSLNADLLEGPFGEFPGSYSGCFMTPTFKVNAITHRNNCIFDLGFTGKPPVEAYYMCCIPAAVAMEQALRNSCPNMTQVAFLLPYYLNCVIQGRWTSRGEARDAILAALASEADVASKIVTVVDEDIDPWNAQDVMWAIATRCQANSDLFVLPGLHTQLDPSVEEDGTTCKLGIDATKPVASSPRHSVAQFVLPRKEPEAWQERILKAMEKGGDL
jgi:UbiD family decarboxylase